MAVDREHSVLNCVSVDSDFLHVMVMDLYNSTYWEIGIIVKTSHNDLDIGTAHTQVRLHQKDQSCQGLHCSPFHWHCMTYYYIVEPNSSFLG